MQFFYQCSDKIILNITDLTKLPDSLNHQTWPFLNGTGS